MPLDQALIWINQLLLYWGKSRKSVKITLSMINAKASRNKVSPHQRGKAVNNASVVTPASPPQSLIVWSAESSSGSWIRRQSVPPIKIRTMPLIKIRTNDSLPVRLNRLKMRMPQKPCCGTRSPYRHWMTFTKISLPKMISDGCTDH